MPKIELPESEDGNDRAEEGVQWCESFSESRKDDEWYEAVADALHILGKRWYSDTTLDEDAFILAYADAIAERPEHEKPCARCSSAAGEEIVHGVLECPRRDLN
jgi:hypothetical protein